MAFTLSEIMAARRQQQQSQRGGRGVVEVDEYSSNPTQAFTFYNINQGRFQPPHVHMVDPLPHDSPKPPGYTRFVCISDTHSRTDTIQMPYGDVLLHAGDFTELGLPSEVKKFNDWLGTLPYEIKIVIAGNHELTFDQEFMADLIKQDFYYFPSASKLKPENYENVQSLLTNCIYLQDSDVTVRGFRIYGSPWQPWYYGWGFNLPRGQALLDKWNQIPDSTDILLTHCPPLGKTYITHKCTHIKHAVMVIPHDVVFILAHAHSFALRLWQMELLQQAAKACNTETLFAVQQIPSHIIKPSHTQSYVLRTEVCA
uniref:Metallophosphoesterase domain containing 1 n=1 Tax=Cyprinus carpio TaxID=7962 RepID=A0A8C2AA77_CYPCA